MKKKLLLFSSAALLGLMLGACGQRASSSSEGGGGGGGGSSDTSHGGGGGDSSETSTVPTSSASGEEEEVEDIDFHGILRIYYHNDASNYANKRLWVWNNGYDPSQEFPFVNQSSPDSYGVYCDFDLGAGAWADTVSTTFSFIVKDAGTWSGQSTDTIVRLGKYSDFIDAANNMITVYACDGEGGNIDTFTKREDALGDRIATAYFSDWKTLHVEGGGVPEGRAAADVGKIASYEIYRYDAEYETLSREEKAARKSQYLIKSGQPDANKADITLDEDIVPYKSYVIEARMSSDTSRVKAKTAAVTKLFDDPKFISDYTYSGNDLGVTVARDGATFKLWAPTSSRVQVKIYGTGTPGDLHDVFEPSSNWGKTYELEYGGHGVWQGKVTDYPFYTEVEDPYYYTYIVTNSAGVNETIDPYATGAGIDGVRGAIIPWESLAKPSNWNDIASGKLLTDIERPNDVSVYEAHIRDLTADKTWTGSERPGTYKAFIEEGTTYNGVKTGFDHIKEMGVKAIQLLPVFDWSNDERWADENGKLITEREDFGKEKIAPAYNWGYNPLNYNVVEGGYSSNPFDPLARINEFRQLVSKCADNDMRVIMDVVYNHFASINGNPLQKVVPNYYLRTLDDGSYYDGTGCGNVTASERTMFRKFIVDSVCQWAKNYNIKGFRFDLMGCHDVVTMRAVKDALYEIDPDIIVYGEGWAGLGDGGFYTVVKPKYPDLHRASLAGVYQHLNPTDKGGVGCFSNGFRNAVKGDIQNDIYPEWGYVSKGGDDLNADLKTRVGEGILGANLWSYDDNCYWDDKGSSKNHTATSGYNNEQTVSYVTCHDNYGLFDQLNYCINSQNKADVDTSSADVLNACVASEAAALLNQGLSFIQGGDEIFRQKVIKPDDPMFAQMEASQIGRSEGHDWLEGDGIKMSSGNYLVRNGYKYGDNVNAFKWDRKVKYLDYFNAIKEASLLRNEQVGNIFGRPYADIQARGVNNVFGSTTWDANVHTPLIADYLQGKKDQANYFLAFGGRASTEWVDLACGNCDIEVLYSSSGAHTKGQKFTIDNGKLGAGKFEYLLVKSTNPRD